jgi:hypothetical protein
MKTVKLAFSIFVITVLTCNYSWGQPFQSDIVVTVTNYDYTVVDPGLGIVSGTYTYHFSYKLSPSVYIEAIHWNAKNFNLYNDKGEKIIVNDAGHDTYGVLWAWFNTPGLMNSYNQAIIYSCPDGWLNDLMPDPMPSEGVAIEMGCKIHCKSGMIRMLFKVILHINANGVVMADVI